MDWDGYNQFVADLAGSLWRRGAVLVGLRSFQDLVREASAALALASPEDRTYIQQTLNGMRDETSIYERAIFVALQEESHDSGH